jgi:hypothetical protein
MKQIPSYPNYSITKDGKVYSHKRHKWLKIYSSSLAPYSRVNLETEPNYIHRLVAETYIPNKKQLPAVGHRNRNIKDNRVENLYWCERKDINTKKVKDVKTNKVYKSVNEASEKTGISRAHLSKMLNGKIKNTSTLILV